MYNADIYKKNNTCTSCVLMDLSIYYSASIMYVYYAYISLVHDGMIIRLVPQLKCSGSSVCAKTSKICVFCFCTNHISKKEGQVALKRSLEFCLKFTYRYL